MLFFLAPCVTLAAKDNFLMAKITQVHFTNRDPNREPRYTIGNTILLAMVHQRHEYMHAKDRHMAKFMLRYDRPYEIIQAFPEDFATTTNLKSTPQLPCIATLSFPHK